MGKTATDVASAEYIRYLLLAQKVSRDVLLYAFSNVLKFIQVNYVWDNLSMIIINQIFSFG